MASESDWLVFAANFSPVAVSDREKARSGAEASIWKRRTRAAAIDRRPTVALEFPRRCYSVRTHAAGAAPARARRAPVPQRVGVRRRRARSSRAAGLCRPDERRVPRRGTPRATGARAPSHGLRRGVPIRRGASHRGPRAGLEVVGPGRLARGDRREDRGDDAERGDPNPSIRVRRGASDPEGDQERRRAGAAIAVVAGVGAAEPEPERAPSFPAERRGGVILGTRG